MAICPARRRPPRILILSISGPVLAHALDDARGCAKNGTDMADSRARRVCLF
jgi:hypothetical protein